MLSLAWKAILSWIRGQKRAGESVLTGAELDVFAAIIGTADSRTGRCDAAPEYLCKLANVSRETLFRSLRVLGDGTYDARGERRDARARVARLEPRISPVHILRREYVEIGFARCGLKKYECDAHTLRERLPGCEHHHGRTVLWLQVATLADVVAKLAGGTPSPLRARPEQKPVRPPGYRSRGKRRRPPCDTSQRPSNDTSDPGSCDTSHSGSQVPSQENKASSSALCWGGVGLNTRETPEPSTALGEPAPELRHGLDAEASREPPAFDGFAGKPPGTAPSEAGTATPQAPAAAIAQRATAHGTESESWGGARARAVPLPSQLHASELEAIAVVWARLGMPLSAWNRKAMHNRFDEGVASLEDLENAAHGAAGCDFARRRARGGPCTVAYANGASVHEYAHRGRLRRQRAESRALAARAEAEKDRAFRTTQRVRVVRPADDAPLAPGELAAVVRALPPPPRPMSAAEHARSIDRQLELLAAASGLEDLAAGDVGEIPILTIRALIDERNRAQ